MIELLAIHVTRTYPEHTINTWYLLLQATQQCLNYKMFFQKTSKNGLHRSSCPSSIRVTHVQLCLSICCRYLHVIMIACCFSLDVESFPIQTYALLPVSMMNTSLDAKELSDRGTCLNPTLPSASEIQNIFFSASS